MPSRPAEPLARRAPRRLNKVRAAMEPTMLNFLRKKERPSSPAEALPGRSEADRHRVKTHFVNGHSLKGPYPAGIETAIFAMGCFWGAERKFWEAGEGVYVTAVGYAGGFYAQSDLSGDLQRAHRPRRSGAGRFRSRQDFLRAPAADLLGES